ncbi:hypothetical protein ABK040_004285 [Willaertia magna]
MGNYHCNRYLDISSHPTIFASCALENVCLTTSGKFLLFLPNDRITMGYKEEFINNLNSKPWIYTQGRVQTDRGNQFVTLVDSDLILEYNNENKIKSVTSIKIDENLLENNFDKKSILEILSKNGKPLKIASNFNFIKKPVYGLKRYASGNMGHFIFENLMMVFTNMINHASTKTTTTTTMIRKDNKSDNNENSIIDKLMDNHILFLDDLFDNSPDNWISVYEYDKDMATKFSLEIPKLISKNSVLQLCKRRNGNFLIEELPCKESVVDSVIDETTGTTTTNLQKENVIDDGSTLQTCFSKLIVGLTKDSFMDTEGKESLVIKYREFAYHSLSIFPKPSQEDDEDIMVNYLSEKPIIIAIHYKSPNSHYGKTIWNTQELSEHLQKSLQNDKYIKRFHSQNRIEVKVFDFKDMNLMEQVKFFSNVDVYITDQGSSAYYCVYMRKGTTVIIAPECSANNECVTTLGFRKLSSLVLNTQVIDYMDLSIGPISCNPRPTPGFSANCDAILSPDIISKAVLASLKKRNKILIQSKLNIIP